MGDIVARISQAFDGSASCLHHSTKTEAHVMSCQKVAFDACQTCLRAEVGEIHSHVQ